MSYTSSVRFKWVLTPQNTETAQEAEERMGNGYHRKLCNDETKSEGLRKGSAVGMRSHGGLNDEKQKEKKKRQEKAFLCSCCMCYCKAS